MNKKLQIEPIDLHELEMVKGGWSYKGCIIANGKCSEGGCGIANGKCPDKDPVDPDPPVDPIDPVDPVDPDPE